MILADTILKIRQEPKVDYDENFTTLITIPIPILIQDQDQDQDQDQETSQEEDTVHESFLSKIIQDKKPRDFFDLFYALRPYLFDLLKTREGFDNFIQSLRFFINTYEDDAELSSIQNIINGLETRDLLILLLESCSPKSMSKLGEWLVTLFYPLPIFYSLPLPPTTNYGHNQNNRFRANLDCCSEVLIQNNKPLILSFGTKSASQKGKSSLLSYLFSTKDPEEFSPKSSFCHYGSIDLYCKTSEVEEKFMIADVHGCTAETNQSLESMILSLYKCSHVTLFHFTRDDLLTKDKENSDSNNNDSEILRFMKSDGMFSEMFLSSSAKPFLLLWRDFNQKTDSDLLGRIEKALKESCHSFSSSSYLGLVPVPDFTSFRGRELQTKKENSKKIIFQNFQKTVSLKSQDQFFSIMNFKHLQPGSEQIQNDSKFVIESLKDIKIGASGHEIIHETVFPFFWADHKIIQIEKELVRFVKDFTDCDEKSLRNLREKQKEMLQGLFKLMESKESFKLSILTKKVFEIIFSKDPKRISTFKEAIDSYKESALAPIKRKYLDMTSRKSDLDQDRQGQESDFDEIRRLRDMIDDIDISLDTFLTEIQSSYEVNTKPCGVQDYQLIKDYLSSNIKEGSPINLINGKTLKFGSKLLKEVFEEQPKPVSEKIFVISIIGAQSSAKSTLLNYLFGCGFATSAGRCTKGLYLSFLRHDNGYCIVIIDTEGLLSIMARNNEFDNQMTLMAFSCSHIVIINHRGEIDTKLQNLLEICVYALKHLKLTDIKPRIIFALRDIVDASLMDAKEILIKMKSGIMEAAQKLAVDIDGLIELSEKDIVLLPSAFQTIIGNNKTKTISYNLLFSREVARMRNKIFEYLENNYRNKEASTLSSFYNKAEQLWNTISEHGTDIFRAKSLLEILLKKQASEIVNEIYDEQRKILVEASKTLIEAQKKDLQTNNSTENDAITLLNREFQKVREAALLELEKKVFSSELYGGIIEYQKEFRDMLAYRLEWQKQSFCEEWKEFVIDCMINKEKEKFQEELTQEVNKAQGNKEEIFRVFERRKEDLQREYQEKILKFSSSKVERLAFKIQNDYECAILQIGSKLDQKIAVPSLIKLIKMIDSNKKEEFHSQEDWIQRTLLQKKSQEEHDDSKIQDITRTFKEVISYVEPILMNESNKQTAAELFLYVLIMLHLD